MILSRSVTAHLNGGPRDDTEVHVFADRYFVARSVNLAAVLAEGPDAAPVPMQVTTGYYRMRLDSNGYPVLHDLAGTIDYDWQGWA